MVQIPDSQTGTWAALNGSEFINAKRTVDYINNLGLPLKVNDCWCSNIQDLLGCSSSASAPYVYPGSDPAPWYDSAIAESSGFLGFLPVEFTGLGSTFTRSTFETLSGGAVLGRLRAQARTLTWRGYLVGINCCAADYGLRWLTAQLADAGGCDGCDGAELDVLLCCPETIECVDCKPSAGIDSVDEAFRTFFRVGLIDGPKVISQRQLGCSGGCNGSSNCGNCLGCLIEVEFSLICGNPYMHKTTEVVCTKPFPSCSDNCDPNDPVWVQIATSAYPANAADGEKCLDSLDCSVLDTAANCILDPKCATATLPTIAPFEDPCGCEGFFTTRVCCEISNDIYGQFFEGVPTIDIFSGSTDPLRNVVISFYENPQERTCSDTGLFRSDCFQCAKLTVRYIPANTTLTIDGLTKRISAKCPGRDSVPAESLTVSPFIFPVLKCISYIVTIEADCSYTVDSDAAVTVSVTPREM